MNEMWAEMSDKQREEYKDYFIAYHNGVAKTGITGKRIKPLTVLPKSVISGFQKALLTQVLFSQWSIRQLLAFANVPLPTELPGTAARFLSASYSCSRFYIFENLVVVLLSQFSQNGTILFLLEQFYSFWNNLILFSLIV